MTPRFAQHVVRALKERANLPPVIRVVGLRPRVAGQSRLTTSLFDSVVSRVRVGRGMPDLLDQV